MPNRPSLVDQLTGAIETPRLRSIALTGLFTFAVVAVLYVAREVFIPLTFALMLSFLFQPFVRGLGRALVPAAVASAFVVAGLLAAGTYGAISLATPATEWIEKLPRSLRVAEVKVRPLRKPVDKVSDLAERVERIARVDKGKPPKVRVETPGLAGAALATLGKVAAAALVVLIALYFLLIWGHSLLEKLISLIPDIRDPNRAKTVIRQIETRMSAYLGTITLINLLLGAAVGASLHFLEMPNAALWGALAAALNFVPYLGAIAGVLIVALAALVSFPDIAQAAAVPGAYLALTVIEGQIVTPIVLGRAFRISPLVIFIWLLFWAWLWGVPGALVAVPMLMLFKITCEQSPHLAPISEFLQR